MIGIEITLGDGDRQLIILSLALTALLRPGWDFACGEIAARLHGRAMYEEFKRYNEDQVRPL